ncbi:MAG: hypothetical protein NZ928_01210 [Endomicrobia bacterium]|nr:hypothetical protein [Endomicrobiia bacterium]
MKNRSILYYIKKLNKPIFTTSELSLVSGKTSSVVVQSLRFLEKEDIVMKVYRGIWVEKDRAISPYELIPYLFTTHRVYVSLISALHLYGIIEQIPQVITLVSTQHTKIIKTKLATFYVYRITPKFFIGFDWYKEGGSFLIAEPEKALVDCLYLSSRKNKQFRFFPELYFPKTFSFKKAFAWVKVIDNPKIAKYVEKKLKEVKQNYR